MKIAVLGAGALGSYYGARLAEAGHELHFIARSSYETMQQKGLVVHSVLSDIFLPHPHVHRRPEDCGPVDLVLVCWKSTCNSKLAETLPPLLKEGTEVITLQNGMGNAEAISRFLPAQNVYIGLCFVCCMMDEPAQIRHLEGGDIQFAPLHPTDAGLKRAEEFAALFSLAKVKSRAYRHAEQILWCKLSWNIPFNGLCLAHGGISVQDLFQMPSEVQRARDIMQEVCQSAELRGFPLPMAIVQEQMERTSLMGPFIPSSAVDYNRHRPIEYDAIWGEPLARAHAVQAEVPHWEKLCEDIRRRIGRA